LMAIFVLVTGPLWARKAWGTYWEWEPRLTLTLVVFFMYVAFLALRGFGGRDDMSKRIAAGLAVAGLPGIYLVRVAVTKWRGTHPRVVWTGGLKNPDFKIAFALGCFAFACLAVCLVWQRYRLERARDEVDEVVLDMMERDLLEDEL
jgi:heme exporter protein C